MLFNMWYITPSLVGLLMALMAVCSQKPSKPIVQAKITQPKGVQK